jgi:hypothetical protein
MHCISSSIIILSTLPRHVSTFIRHPQGDVPKFLMPAGSMFYINCCIPLQWGGTRHFMVKSKALVVGVPVH